MSWKVLDGHSPNLWHWFILGYRQKLLILRLIGQSWRSQWYKICWRQHSEEEEIHRLPKLATPLDISWCKIVNTWQIFYKMWNIHGDDHSELVFKACAQSGHLWPRRKLLGGWATAWWPPCQYAGQVHPIQSANSDVIMMLHCTVSEHTR